MAQQNARPIMEEYFYTLIGQKEGDFLDFKSKSISGVGLQESIVALANADGGELLVGIHDEKNAIGKNRFDGFVSIEEANSLLSNLRMIQPSMIDAKHEFMELEGKFILSLVIPAKVCVYKTSSGEVFLRKGAQNLHLNEEEIKILEYSKGARKREEETISIEKENVSQSNYIQEYCKRVPILSDPESFLKKETLIYENKPRLAAVVCLSDCPQSAIKCGVKIYRMRFSKTESKSDYKRAYLDEKNVFTLEGPAEILILEAVKKVKEIMESMKFKQYGKPDTNLQYPPEAIHELITNAVIHRDYSVEDDIHIRIFDNQIDIISPGGFPANITPKNIKDSRYSRNPRIVRILHKLPDRVNKDLGEGIDTVINSMRQAKLTPPNFSEQGNYVIASLKHTTIASYETQVLEYLTKHNTITNREARKITGEEDKVKIKNIFLKLISQKKIEVVNPNESRDKRKYSLIPNGKTTP